MTRVALVLVTVVLLLAGCASTGVRLPRGAGDLEPCDWRRVTVDELEVIGQQDCNMEGWTLVLPDGKAMEMMAPGGVGRLSQSDGSEFLVANWGVPGIGVAKLLGDRIESLWGSTEQAKDLTRQQIAIET